MAEVQTEVNINWQFGEAFRGFIDSIKEASGSATEGIVGLSTNGAFVLFSIIMIVAAGYHIFRRLR
tara:strand:+ start:2208 stop:2405 length:198 start_codon:yes stop_codon:yes gene_type:complete